MSELLVRKTAAISDCGTYRYRLTRQWGAGEMLPFVMLNPSTADASLDDPTIRRCMGFARREGYGGLVVVNLYALRSTNPDRLREVSDPFGPDNAEVLTEIAVAARDTGIPVVCAWGAGGSVHGGHAIALALFRRLGAKLRCLGRTKEGHPRHPLYVRGDQPLEAFPV